MSEITSQIHSFVTGKRSRTYLQKQISASVSLEMCYSRYIITKAIVFYQKSHSVIPYGVEKVSVISIHINL